MSGIYLHIPFCKQACHYCNFHFSTNLKRKEELIKSLCTELIIRKRELNQPLQTIYFGGGTPSLLSEQELKQIFNTIHKHYIVVEDAEITLEANPDDLSSNLIVQLHDSQINRLSIGVQSFFAEDLLLMNRVHSANEALECIKLAKKYFKNISIDLIYGIPGLTIDRWKENLEITLSLDIPHISCYALTVEPKTALKKFIEQGKVAPVNDEETRSHYELMIDTLENAGYINYEFSNFGKPGYFSQNNTGYWQGKPYLGIGPSAHSFDGNKRSWNISNNIKYIKSINNGNIPLAFEVLSVTDKYNEYIMTGLRTMWGVSLVKVENDFGKRYRDYLLEQVEKHVENQLLYIEDDILKITKKGKFLGDGIASDLFLVNLS